MINKNLLTDKCRNINCQNGGTCKLKESRPFCECTEEYTGEICETRKYIMSFEKFIP